MTVSSKTTPTPAPAQLITRDKSTLSVGVYCGSDSSDTVVTMSVVQGCKSREVCGGGVLWLHEISSHRVAEIYKVECFKAFRKFYLATQNATGSVLISLKSSNKLTPTANPKISNPQIKR